MGCFAIKIIISNHILSFKKVLQKFEYWQKIVPILFTESQFFWTFFALYSKPQNGYSEIKVEKLWKYKKKIKSKSSLRLWPHCATYLWCMHNSKQEPVWTAHLLFVIGDFLDGMLENLSSNRVFSAKSNNTMELWSPVHSSEGERHVCCLGLLGGLVGARDPA